MSPQPDFPHEQPPSGYFLPPEGTLRPDGLYEQRPSQGFRSVITFGLAGGAIFLLLAKLIWNHAGSVAFTVLAVVAACAFLLLALLQYLEFRNAYYAESFTRFEYADFAGTRTALDFADIDTWSQHGTRIKVAGGTPPAEADIDIQTFNARNLLVYLAFREEAGAFTPDASERAARLAKLEALLAASDERAEGE